MKSTNTPGKRRRPGIRSLAVDILVRVDAGAYADALLQASRQRRDLDPRDQGLLHEIVLGTLSRRATIDHTLAAYASRPPDRIDARILNLLRSAVYQIQYLDRVPSYAVVSESVEIARDVAHAGAARFVNAILRGVAENRRRVRLPDPSTDAVRHLAISESYPEWMVRRWVKRVGVEGAAALCRAGNARPPLNIRVNTTRSDAIGLASALAAEGIITRPHPYLSDCLVVEEVITLFTSEAYRSGLFYVQGPAAVRVARLLDVKPGHRVLDVCAAPGGKACAAALATGPGGTVTALDNRVSRVRTIRQNADRLQIRVDAVTADARVLPTHCAFDRVLVDAPCSALGIIARHPEIKWHRVEEDISRMADLQLDLLGAAARAVKPGGRLLYATCTTEPEENDNVVEAFLGRRPEFRLSRADRVVDDVDAGACLRISPTEDGADGAFAALFERTAT